MHFHGSTQVDEVSDVAATQVLHRPRRVGRRVSSDSDVPLVRGSRFAVLTESDELSDNEPLMCPAGQTRDEDDINTVPASSGAVAAHLGVPAILERAPVREFDLTDVIQTRTFSATDMSSLSPTQSFAGKLCDPAGGFV